MRVAIAGAGFAGLGLAIRLRLRQELTGATWDDEAQHWCTQTSRGALSDARAYELRRASSPRNETAAGATVQRRLSG